MPEMIKFSLSILKNPKDLLELYCGSGTPKAETCLAYCKQLLPIWNKFI